MRRLIVVGMVILGGGAAVAGADDAVPEYHLTLKDHRFTPAMLNVPANTKLKVLVTNGGTTPAEFESTDFNREKIVLPNSTITLFIGPLGKGSYKFFNDFDRAATGVLVAR